MSLAFTENETTWRRMQKCGGLYSQTHGMSPPSSDFASGDVQEWSRDQRTEGKEINNNE